MQEPEFREKKTKSRIGESGFRKTLSWFFPES